MQEIFTVKNIVIYFIIINLIGFFIMWLDKRKAKKGAWRIPEKTLFIITALGGGIGTAPLYQLAKELAAKGEKPSYFAGFRDEPYRMEAFAPFCQTTALATDSGRFGHHGLVTELFDPKDFDVICCCGPTPMMKAVTKLALEAGTEVLVSLENKMAFNAFNTFLKLPKDLQQSVAHILSSLELNVMIDQYRKKDGL